MTGSDNPRPLLVELLVEELPPKALRKLSLAFARGVLAALKAEGLVESSAIAEPFATPRRLALRIDSVRSAAPSRAVSHKLMPASVGLAADGSASPALLKKLTALGADASAVARLQRRSDGKSESLYLDTVAEGASIATGLQRALEQSISALPIPKLMQYQLADGWTSVSFVRPAHGLVALHGHDVVPVRVLGLAAGRTTLGHRFEASVAPIDLRWASTYEAQLADDGAVTAGFDERRDAIVAQLRRAAAELSLRPIDDEALLDEVTALVERPKVFACAFEAEFLEVPAECLILTMKANQRYFPLVDEAGKLTNRFLVVSNISPADPSRVIEGNERVVRPRLADAKFFFDQDRKKTLASRVPGLDRVVYHGKLGSEGDRMRRVCKLAAWVAAQIGANVENTERAAFLSKADLLTDMVGEFPELQGIMGGYYAEHDGEKADVARAIRGQYENRRDADDGDVAPNLVGAALILATRAETLVGIWSIGLKPTGDKDPYALRRHALTLIKTFELLAAFNPSFALGLHELLSHARRTFTPEPEEAVVTQLQDFIFERYFHQLATHHDSRAVDAVIALRPPLHETVQRLNAVRDFSALPEALSLAAANKRVGNILKKSDAALPTAIDATLLVEPAEQALARALDDCGGRADAAYRGGRYAESLRLLAGLKGPVDAFFDGVMVNAEAPALRANRLALLASLRTTMNRVADLSRLAV